MGLSDMFRFTSVEERQKKSDEYQKKIFPLGLEQRELALKTLRPLIRPKIKDTELLFVYVVAKEAYLDGKFDGLDKHLRRQRSLTAQEIAYVKALVQLDAGLVSLDGYPDAETVKETVKQEGTL